MNYFHPEVQKIYSLLKTLTNNVNQCWCQRQRQCHGNCNSFLYLYFRTGKLKREQELRKWAVIRPWQVIRCSNYTDKGGVSPKIKVYADGQTEITYKYLVDCNLKTKCAPSYHDLTINHLLAWWDVNCRKYFVDCNLEMVCTAPHHGVTFYNVSAWSNVI